MSEKKEPKIVMEPIAIEAEGWSDCEDQHFSPNLDKLAPMEAARTFSTNDLDDLDWRANAIALGWHTEEETQEDIMALARAVPRLTAALRAWRAPCR